MRISPTASGPPRLCRRSSPRCCPAHFEQATTLVTEDPIRAKFPAGSDPRQHLAAIDNYPQAGYDELRISNIGPHGDGFFDLYATQVLSGSPARR